MTTQMHASLRYLAIALLSSISLCATGLAQQPTLASFKVERTMEPVPAISTPLPQASEQHKFWDTQNRVLFTAVAAFSAADFAVTRANLQNGGQELNPVTR